ncbi:hypothetical protein C7U61_13450 [Rhizobium sp. JAB6]|uniref:hypothetical protein n=1 Tax=Rhizobium sp. JAB6 TaxID=2127050 RepID=UPI000D13755F|nr:hypothetical protein [Rhizobium sp. JAB6]PST19506.1 hypothetical protein C7U61_13450 [Rhizobium sp. JAB6]
MNIKRGLFRLWLVLSVIFAGLVFLITWSSMRAEFDRAALTKYVANANAPVVVPVMCGEARGTANVDYTTEKRLAKPNPYDICWYDIPKYRTFYPEDSALSDTDLSDRLHWQMNIPINHLKPPHPWNNLARIVSLAFGFPLAVLLLGWWFMWAFSGFSRKPEA